MLNFIKKNTILSTIIFIVVTLFMASEQWALWRQYLIDTGKALFKVPFTKGPTMYTYFAALPQANFKTTTEMIPNDQHLKKTHLAMMEHIKLFSAGGNSPLAECFSSMEKITTLMEDDLKVLCSYDFSGHKLKVLDYVTE